MKNRFSYNSGGNYLTIEPQDDLFVVVAHKTISKATMVVSNPRPYDECVSWVSTYVECVRWVSNFIGETEPVDYDSYEEYLSDRLGF